MPQADAEGSALLGPPPYMAKRHLCTLDHGAMHRRARGWRASNPDDAPLDKTKARKKLRMRIDTVC